VHFKTNRTEDGKEEHCLKAVQFFVFFFYLLYWGYIVTLQKFLQYIIVELIPMKMTQSFALEKLGDWRNIFPKFFTIGKYKFSKLYLIII
jgi:hypothetical protein